LSQNVWSTINAATTSGTQLASLLNDFKVALMSGLKGPSRPAQLVSSGLWVDDALESGSNLLTLKLYDGVQDINLLTINKATGTASISSSESQFEILRTSDDTVGAKLRLKKKRTTGNQAKDGDTLGEVLFYGVRDDSGEALQARIYSVSSDDVTALAQGAYMAFEITEDSTAAAVEIMRLINNKVGIGLTAPEETLHVKGTAIKSEKVSDDAVAAKFKLHKKRITGSGGVQSLDSVGEIGFFSKTSTSADIEVARCEVTATEAHTSSAQGSNWLLKTKNNGSTAFTTKITVNTAGVSIPELLPGSGGGGTFSAVQNITAGGTITPGSGAQQILLVQGSGGPQDAHIVPFSSTPTDGTILILIGQDDSKILTIFHNDAAGGCLLKGDCYLGKDDTLMLVRNNTTGRYNELNRSVH